MKDSMKIEFVGKDLPEIIRKIADFLNNIKGINLGGKDTTEVENEGEGHIRD